MYMFWKGPVIILIGSVFSLLLFKGFSIPKRIRKNYFLSFALFILAVILPYKNLFIYSKYISEYLTAVLTATAIAISMANRDFLDLILKNRILRSIGVLSYSIYIWQELFIGARPWQPWLNNFVNYPLWALIIIKLTAVAIIAIASYRFELVFLKMKARYYNCIVFTNE
jgi:peptidoglycan/LPS O-acetylase OafA/YrhL